MLHSICRKEVISNTLFNYNKISITICEAKKYHLTVKLIDCVLNCCEEIIILYRSLNAIWNNNNNNNNEGVLVSFQAKLYKGCNFDSQVVLGINTY